jgi:hypothetical protein
MKKISIDIVKKRLYDLYENMIILKEETYIKVKGFFREKDKLKWDWFHKAYPNSELWDKTKLKELGIL